MTVLNASRNGHHRVADAACQTSSPPAEPVPQNEPRDAAEAIAAMKSLEDHLLTLSAKYPRQLHLRGLRRSGKSTLGAAMDDVVEARINGPTERSVTLLEQSLRIVHGEGASPTPLPPIGPGGLERVERLTYSRHQTDLLVVSLPEEPLGGMARRRGAELYGHPNWMLVPVIWAPRAHADAARNVFFGLAAELQGSSPEGTDTRKVLETAFQIAFNEPEPDALTRYGADGLAELLNDDDLGSSRLRISSRRGPLARISFDGLGRRSKKYEEVLVELAGKVVRVADKVGHNAFREVLQSIDDPLLYVCGWDFVTGYDALWRQPNLETEIFQKFLGVTATRTSKNFFLQGTVRGRIKTGADLGKVYVHDTAKEGAASLLAEFETRVLRSATVSFRKPQTPIAAAPSRPQPETTENAPLAIPVPTATIAAPPAVVVEPVVTAREEDACTRGDEVRETIFRGLGLMPAVVVAVAILWLSGVSAATWWVTLGVLLAGTAAAAYLWTHIRTRHCDGAWTCRSDGTVQLRRPVKRILETNRGEVIVEASPLERWLDTGRCYASDEEVRAWRIFRLSRFEAAFGRKAARSVLIGIGLPAAIVLILLVFVRLFVG